MIDNAFSNNKYSNILVLHRSIPPRLSGRFPQTLVVGDEIDPRWMMIIEMGKTNERGQPNCTCKVGKAREQFSLDSLDESLIQQRRENETSLRDLADFVNRSILDASIDAHASTAMPESEAFGVLDRDETIERMYDILSGDDVPTDRRARVESQLTQAGVDIEMVRSAWVTHPTLRTHLRECLDVDTSHSPDITTGSGIQTIEWARSQCVAIVERTIQRLIKAGQLVVGDPDVSLSLRITCTQCNKTYRPTELIDGGSCSCSIDSTEDTRWQE